MTIDRRPEGQNGRFPMSLHVSKITGASTTSPKRPKRRKSRAPRRPPPAKARQHDIVQDIVPKTAVTVAPDRARDQVPVDGPSPAAMIDQLWQANPLQKLLPVDWGAITQALSTLSARSMADPVHAAAVAANLSLKLWQEAAETWIGAASRWWGLATPTEDKLRGPAADRRFEAPEWEQHPFFRVLKQSYLAIAAQLREEADREVPDPTERHRLMFHVQQLIDATSPTLFLPTNPAALRKALETGGGSVADGLATLLPICARVG